MIVHPLKVQNENSAAEQPANNPIDIGFPT
jgi:hypothetical protein